MKAIILAGGEEVVQIGMLHRMALLPIPTNKGTIPVINSNVDKLLEIPDVEQILVLVKKEHETKFRQWQDIYYRDKQKVVINCDEDFTPQMSNTRREHKKGPLLALSQAITGLQIDKSGNPFIVVPGHNYFEDSLKRLVETFKKTKMPTIAYRKLRFQESVRNDLQTVRLKDHIITDLIDSPTERMPSDTNVLITCYILTGRAIQQLQHYVKHNPNSLNRTWRFLQWLITKTNVCGCEFINRCWDFGTEGDYGDLLWIINRDRLLIRKVDDLIRAKEADALPDACFLLGRRFVINPSMRTITVTFTGEDAVCGDERYVGNAMAMEAVRESTSKLEERNIKKLENSLLRTGGSKVSISFRKGTGIFLSGGVFLFDTPAGGLQSIKPERLYIPLLERDYGAKADPGRLTTPAGRLDDLNLRALCYSELLEELVFYGLHPGNNICLFSVFPDDLADSYRVKGKLINRLLGKNIMIPGLDLDKLKEMARNPEADKSGVISVLSPFEPQLQNVPAFRDEPFWTVNIRMEERLTPEPISSVYVIFDRQNHTIEFRLVAFANISEFASHTTQSYGVHAFGRLRGIADGDGYQRRTFLISAEGLADYYRRVVSASKKQNLDDYLFKSGEHSVEIARMGEGVNAGRFSASNIKVPVLSLTTSLSKMAKLTSKLIGIESPKIRTNKKSRNALNRFA